MSSDTSQGLFLQIPVAALNHNNKKQVLNIHLMTTAVLPNIAVPVQATRAWLHVYSCVQNTLGSPQVKLSEVDWSMKQVQQIQNTWGSDTSLASRVSLLAKFKAKAIFLSITKEYHSKSLDLTPLSSVKRRISDRA